jgi:hypothetical protein
VFFCSNDIESISHLFCSCPFSYNLRSDSNWMGIQDVHHVEGVQHFLMHGNVVVGSRMRRTRHLISMVVVWCL